MGSPTVQQIAQQNDQFRQGDPSIPGQRFVTAGINELVIGGAILGHGSGGVVLSRSA